MKTVSGILGAALVAAGIGFSAPASADKILVAELTGTIQYDSNAPLATQPTVFDPLTPVGGGWFGLMEIGFTVSGDLPPSSAVVDWRLAGDFALTGDWVDAEGDPRVISDNLAFAVDLGRGSFTDFFGAPLFPTLLAIQAFVSTPRDLNEVLLEIESLTGPLGLPALPDGTVALAVDDGGDGLINGGTLFLGLGAPLIEPFASQVVPSTLFGLSSWDRVDSVDGALRGRLVLTAVPEPAALGLLGIGLLGVTFARRRRLEAA